ncbi:MAG: four helix bundle protein [Burkholderiales bacterium]|nr:four helix bundle protein [Opitutaceae bacterium]
MGRDDLAGRTEQFASDVRAWLRAAPRTEANREDLKQLVRASGSVAANHIEADNALGDADRLMKFRICRKVAREAGLWLRLMHAGDDEVVRAEQDRLNDESQQLMRIYSSIIRRLGGD